jgi:hypothetical protein
MGRTQFAVGAALPVGALLVTAPGAGAAPGAASVYTVTSDAPLTAVAYSDATGATQKLTNQPAPWTISFTSQDPDPNATLVLTARPTGQQTTCTISVNGTVNDTKSSTGAGDDHMVMCGTWVSLKSERAGMPRQQASRALAKRQHCGCYVRRGNPAGVRLRAEPAVRPELPRRSPQAAAVPGKYYCRCLRRSRNKISARRCWFSSTDASRTRRDTSRRRTLPNCQNPIGHPGSSSS